MSKRFILHMIGNAHIDPVWLWKWDEGLVTTRATFKSAIERIEEYSEFIFTASSACLYKWVEETDPKLFKKIQEKVEEGRWCIVGGWWIEPDCNIPSGEALVRQGLYGQKYFEEKFGIEAKVGYNPDSFGHNWMIPQILKKMGIDYYVFMRPGPHEKDLPEDIFWWESPDGSRILAYRVPFSYATWGKEVESQVKRVAEKLNEKIDTLMCFYGVGDHGGGPTKENIENIIELDKREDLPRLIFSSPNKFFEEISSKGLDFPVVKDDLQHHASGCYSVLSWIKKNNRKLEHLLLNGEKIAIMGREIKNLIYPKDNLRIIWQTLLFTQFHDILAGTSIPEAYEDIKAMHGGIEDKASKIIVYATHNIANDINTQGKGEPLIVFNTTSFERMTPIEIDIPWGDKNLSILDTKDNLIPSQISKPSATTPGGRVKIIFTDKLLPYGYKVYRIVPEKYDVHLPYSLNVKENILENDWLYLEIDTKTGYIKRLYDKENEKDVFLGNSAVPVVIDDPSDTWSHNVFSFKNEIGRFLDAKIKVLEAGPIKGTVKVESHYNKSKLIQEFTIYRTLKYIEVKVTVDWHEQLKMLKLKFPVNVNNPIATYQIPYGFITRPSNGEEEPGGEWVDVGDGNYGLSIINNAKYSYDVDNNVLSLTVLRSPVYAHHIPRVLDPHEDYRYIDQGEQDFTYIIYPHKGDWRDSDTVKLAESLNNPVIAFVEYKHPGILPQEQSFISVDKENIIVTVIKEGEDSDDIILRAYETIGKETKAKFKLFDRIWFTTFKPCEIKSFSIPKDKNLSVREVNLLEE
ncbi:MAG: alpha-mannosidase [bacterium]|nr:alpha-mannosidase [bacterium]